MTYNITTTSGSNTYTVTNGATNIETNLSFIGKGTLNYGSALNTNFLRLLENFAYTTQPDRPVTGQLWYDTTLGNQKLKVYDGADFVIVAPNLSRITSSVIGNLAIAANAIVGETTNANISISANGTGNVVVSRLAITGTTTGRVLYTAANGMVMTNAMQYDPTSDTLTAAYITASSGISGTLTTAAQGQVTSLGTLTGLTVNGTANMNTIRGSLGGPFNGTVGATTPNTGAFTTITATGNVGFGSVFANGAAGSQFIGYHTGAIGSNVANTGAFTTITSTGNVGFGSVFANASAGSQFIGYLTGAIGANIANSGVFTSVTTASGGQVTGYHTGAIGANTANTGVFTSVTTASGGQVTGYHTGAIGANTANTGVFTSVTTASGGQVTGYHTGAIGANTANTGAFTTITATGNVGFGSVFANASAGSQFIGYLTGAIGANVANLGVFTSVTTTSGGQVTGYLTGAIGANVANLGVFTSVATTSGGQLTGYHTGAIGANTANTGAFTTITATSVANVGNVITSGGIYWANGNAFQSGITYTAATTPPNLPKLGDQWYYTTSDILYSRVSDGTSSYWLDISSAPSTIGYGSSSISVYSSSNIVAQVNGATVLNVYNGGINVTGAISATSVNATNVNATTITGTHNGPLNGPFNGTVGATTANTGAFTTLTTTGTATINSTSGVTAIANGGTTGVGNIGAIGATFNTVFAKATTAQYADLAENYIADRYYETGSVVVFGGAYQITANESSYDTRVAGVISTDPAYLMNNIQTEKMLFPVALVGMVPCKVKGPVNKGDLLVSSEIPGVAMKLDNKNWLPGCVIGKSLEDYDDSAVKKIEVVIGRF